MNRFIIFGGGGFIGSHLVRELKQRAITDITFADIAEPASDMLTGTRFVLCDVRKSTPAEIVMSPAIE